VVHEALDCGINLLDTADIYGDGHSEEFVGKALQGRRDTAIVATKFGNRMPDGKCGAHPDYVHEACDASLRRLGIEVIDLYQLHTPDKLVPIGETLGALNELVQAGKVREIGCSNFSAEQIQEAEFASRTFGYARFMSVQNEFSLLKQDPRNGVLDKCAKLGLGFLPYFPLKSGLLSGKYRKGQPAPEGTRLSGERYQALLNDGTLDTVERLIAYAESKGHTILELAFGWLAAHKEIASVIAGATTPEQVRSNVAAMSWIPNSAELAEVAHVLF
jgi:aryl-alcohol dehydrogenase-like predicted oxidoreductase